MGKFIDLTGQRFGRLVVLHKDLNSHGVGVRFICKCDCGKEKSVLSSLLRYGGTKSCGCLRSDLLTKESTKHGLRKHPIYNVWNGMIGRCTNRKKKAYQWYGGRGISICDEWLNGPEKFIQWAESNGWAPGLQLDRIDNNKGYSPENCRFVTRLINNRNRSDNVFITHPYTGETLCAKDWSDRLGGKPRLVGERIKKLGWSPEKAITTPVRRRV